MSFAKYLCVLCVKANAESEKTRHCVLDRQKTQRSRRKGRRVRKEEESRGSVFVDFAVALAFFALKPMRKVKGEDIAFWIGRKRKVREARPAKDAKDVKDAEWRHLSGNHAERKRRRALTGVRATDTKLDLFVDEGDGKMP